MRATGPFPRLRFRPNACSLNSRIWNHYGHRFPGVAFGGARADTRAAARGARAVGPERGIGSSPVVVRIAGRGGARMARGLRRYHRRALRACPQGTLAVVRGVAGEGGDGEGLGPRCDVNPAGVAVSGGGAERFGGTQGDRGSPYVLERLGRKARRRGGKAKKRGLSREQVPVLNRSGTTVSAVLPRVEGGTRNRAASVVRNGLGDWPDGSLRPRRGSPPSGNPFAQCP